MVSTRPLGGLGQNQMGKPKTDSGDKKNSSNSGSGANQSSKSGASPKQNPAKLPPAGFIYSDDENLMDELSMGWGLTASEEEDELDAIINKTMDMGKVSSTKLKALAEPPKSGVERIERVRAERASREIAIPDSITERLEKEKNEKEAAAKRAREQAAERELAQRAAAQREQAERALAEKEAQERAAALKARADEEAIARAEREAKERAEAEARERAEIAAKEQAEREAQEQADKEEAAKEAAAKAKAERDAAERDEAEREIAERERLQKEAAAKLRAKQAEAKREAEEQEEQERAERERIEKEAESKAAEAKAAKVETPKASTSSLTSKERPAIRPQKIGLKADDQKPVAAAKSETNEKASEVKAEPKPETKSATPSGSAGSTAKLSRTPEEELAALLAEDEPELAPQVEPVKPVKSAKEEQDTRTSRHGLAAMEPADDTPLTGMLKAIKPNQLSKAPAKASPPPETKEESEPAADQEGISDSEIEVATTSGDMIAAEKSEDTSSSVNVPEDAGLLSSEIVGSPLFEPEADLSENLESAQESEVPEFLKTDSPPKVEGKNIDKLQGVDKFYKPERVKLGDFVKKSKPEVTESKPAEPEAEASAELTAATELSQMADLPTDNLPVPKASIAEKSGDFARPSKEEIRDSVKTESPEKKAQIIAALKKLEEQVDETDLDTLSTDSLKDVLAKLPDMSSTPSSSPVAGKKEGTRGRMPSNTAARLAPLEEPGPDRDIAREKLKVMQKMTHKLPELKSYLPHKRAVLILVAVAILGTLAAVMTVRLETISARKALEKKDYNAALSSLGLALALYPFSAEGHFLRGSALYLSDNYKDAYSEYDTALKLSPDMHIALARRAAVSYKLGNYAQSVADYEKLLQKEGGESQSFDQLLSLANAYLRVGDLQKAADMYNRCLDRKPDYIAAMVGKIAVSNERQLFERASIEAGKALVQNPTNKDVLVLRARAFTGMHSYAQAQKDIDAALKKAPKSGAVYAARANLRLAQRKNSDAFADFNTALKFSPKDSTIYLERAQAYINDHKYDLAAKDIGKAKSIMGAQLTAQLFIVNSQVQIANKQAAKALEDLTGAQEKFARNPEIILAKADALAATGKISDAIVTTEKAMEMDKNDVDAILKHGLLSLKFGNKMRAAADFADVIKLDPGNILAYKTRGMLYLQQEKYASAQEDLSKVVALDPTQTDAKAGLDKAKTLFARITRVRPQVYHQDGPSDAYLAGLASKDFNTLINDGFAAYKKGDTLTAVPTLEQAVKVNPRDARARRYLAYAYKSADQLGEAASQFDALYPLGALNAQDTSIYIDMLAGSGQQEKATKVLEDALAKTPGAQSLYLQLATSQANMGDVPKAIQTCNKGITINPRTAIAQQLIELRKNLMTNGAPRVIAPDPGA